MKSIRENRTAWACALLAVWGLADAGTALAGDWHIDVVDSTGVGGYSSMKIDREGNVHVAYVVQPDTLRYAFWDRHVKRWFNMGVAKGVGMCDLTLDSMGRPHISYVDSGSTSGAKLRYTHWDGQSWKTQPIPLNSDIIAYYDSIVLDPQDNPTISFYEYRGPKDTEIKIRLRTVMWNGRYWEVRTIDPEEGSGKFNSMAVDSQGHIHLAYANVSEGSARHAYWDGKTWTRDVIESHEAAMGYTGYSMRIVIDKEDQPHAAYTNASSNVVEYAARRNGRWQVEPVDRLSSAGYPDRNSIALDDEGRPYIGYFDAGRGLLFVAHKEGQKWVSESVDGSGSGFTSSMQIDHDQTLWIGYADQGAGVFKVAHRELNAQAPVSSASTAPVSRKEVH